jgi:hypothetical protein
VKFYCTIHILSTVGSFKLFLNLELDCGTGICCNAGICYHHLLPIWKPAELDVSTFVEQLNCACLLINLHHIHLLMFLTVGAYIVTRSVLLKLSMHISSLASLQMYSCHLDEKFRCDMM